MDLKLFTQAIFKFLGGLLIVGLLLFLPAGTFVWRQAWLLLEILFVPMFIAGLIMMKRVPDLLRKTLVPFSTHEGSGLSGFDKKLSSAIPDSTVLKGLATRGNDCQNQQDSVREAVRNWIAELGMKKITKKY